jgi:hypothetical protein
MKISTSIDKQRIPSCNITIAMAALVSLMANSITKKEMNKANNNAIFILLFSVIGLSLLSLSVSIMMINAQASYGSTSGGISGSGTGDSGSEGNNGKDQKQKDNTDTQMGICLVGAGGPCNGNSV